VRIRVVVKAPSVVALIVAVLIGGLWYSRLGHHGVTTQARTTSFRDATEALQSTNAPLILAAADHFYWLNNGPAAAPLYARAEKLFSANSDKRNELHAHIGQLRSEAETMSFVDLSRYLGEELQTPMLKQDKELRLRCLIAKGYTDVEIDYRATKRDWLEARDLANALGQVQWVTRADGELGLVAFLEGNPGHAARLLGGALLSTMASGDRGGQIRFLELLGRGFEEVNRHAEAMRFFDRAIKLADGEGSGLPFMAYEGKAHALVAVGKPNEANAMLQDALAKARTQQKRGHEATLLILLGTVAESIGNRTQAIQYLEQAGQLATSVQFSRMEADAMFELAKLYRDAGDLVTADARATKGLAASQRVGDRYYLPRNLTTLADLKTRRGRTDEANALYEQAEDVIEGMLISVDETYWNSSVSAAMSQTYLQHFELAARTEDVPNAFRILERVRGRTLAWALKDKKGFPISESPQTIALESELANVQGQLMRTSDRSKREQLLDQLVEDERRLGLAWTKDNVAPQRLPAQPVDLSSIQNDLKPDEALLEYVLNDPNSFCLAITRSGTHLHELPNGSKEIERLTHAFVAGLRARQSGADVSHQLFNSLIAPIPEAENATRLIVVPDGVLNLLPFEALRDQQGQYLLRSKTISYVPSGTILDALRHAENEPPAARPLLAVGDVAYENQGGAGHRIPKPASFLGRVERPIADLSGMALRDLPETREEVREIGKIAGPDAVLLMGKGATETAFKKEPLDRFRVLHLAVHGFADTQYPERSALVLGADSEAGDDGLLQVREIIRLRLNAELTTLSACDTGVGKLQGQEGISNLVGAFLVAGSRSVVASLWGAEDTSASALMERFYDYLAHGENTSSALRNAKLDLLAKFGDQLSPYYWAEFVSVGETSAPVGIAK
jgi:CHAT domain-containing protein/tetratricopeptide (TPR) repeat protein